jgi:hypothetical protein
MHACMLGGHLLNAVRNLRHHRAVPRHFVMRLALIPAPDRQIIVERARRVGSEAYMRRV